MNLTAYNQSDRCENFSCPERSVSPAVYILLYMCSVAVVLITSCGNMLVIISVFHFKQLHTPTNTLVLSLAVSDFLVGALVMLPELFWTIESCWIFGRSFCTIFWLTGTFVMAFSIYNIVLIAVDRYLALSNPFLYSNKISTRTMCIVVYSNWCVCLCYSMTLYNFNEIQKSFLLCPGECLMFLNEVWIVIDLVYLFIFPLSVIIILYTQVFVIAMKHVTAIRELNNHTQPKSQKTQKITSHSMKSERKAAKVLGILVSVFLVCLLPYFIYSLLGNLIEFQTETIHKLLILLYLNSSINPFIYALFYPWFRRCMKLVITLKIFETDSALINVLS